MGAGDGGHGKIRVVLADDHEIVRAGLASLLRTQPDMDVVGEAADGQMALTLARSANPDVIVMDVSMPGMSGVEATRRLRAELPHIQVIALSMHDQDQMAAAMQAAGAATYVNKGGPPELLIDAIRVCVGRHPDGQ